MLEHKPRQNYVFHKRALSSSPCPTDTEIDHRVYRSLLARFTDNLNAMTRNFNGCILDLDQHFKIRVSQEEQRLLEVGLQQIIKKMMPKLVREGLHRNAGIKREYHEFVRQYEPVREQLRKVNEESKVFVSVRSEGKRLAMGSSFSTRNVTERFSFMRPLQRMTKFRELSTGRGENSQPKMQEGPGGLYLMCKMSEFKAFQSEQLVRRRIGRAKTTSDWYKTSGKISIKDSAQLEDQDSPENNDFQQVNKEVLISEPFRKGSSNDQEWKIERDSTMKPVQKFSSSRVFAVKNRGGSNPETCMSKPNILTQKNDLCISTVKARGYQARSRLKDRLIGTK